MNFVSKKSKLNKVFIRDYIMQMPSLTAPDKTKFCRRIYESKFKLKHISAGTCIVCSAIAIAALLLIFLIY